MADYYAVLKRTLSGFGEPSDSLRAKIYDKARITISRQLDATQPPLADEVKAAQLAQLDDAIAQTEAEYAGPSDEEVGADDFVAVPPPIAEEPVVADALPVEPDPQPEPDVEPVPDPVIEPDVSEPPREEPTVVEPDVTEPVDVAPADEPEAVVPDEPAPFTEPEVADEPQATPVDPLAEAFAAIEAARAEDGLDDHATDTDDVGIDDDAFSAAAQSEGFGPVEVGGAAAAGAAAGTLGGVTPVTAGNPGTSDFFNDPSINEREAAALGAPAVTMPAERKGKGKGVLTLLLIVAALGIGYLFRAPVLSAVGLPSNSIDRLLGMEGEPTDAVDPDDPTRPKPVPTIRITPQPEPAETGEADPADEAKREQRLNADGQETDATPTREDVGTLPAPSVPTIDGPDTTAEPAVAPDAAPAEPETTTTTVPIVPPASETETPTAAPDDASAVTPAVEEETAATAPPASEGTVPVAQSALLFEEVVGQRQQKSDRGNVVWSTVQESPGNGEPAEPAIRASIDIPERELKATITIRRNTDKGLTASHLIEVNFEPAPGFSGQNIDEVLAVTMKADERAQGSPLSIVPAKIAPGFFFIALDNLPASRDRNVNLLRSSKWIDLPVEYVTGRRALLSLEKGVVGEQVFSDALTAWDAKG